VQIRCAAIARSDGEHSELDQVNRSAAPMRACVQLAYASLSLCRASVSCPCQSIVPLPPHGARLQPCFSLCAPLGTEKPPRIGEETAEFERESERRRADQGRGYPCWQKCVSLGAIAAAKRVLVRLTVLFVFAVGGNVKGARSAGS
jgi:hypothetical protein